MTPVEIESAAYKSWKDFLDAILVKRGSFEKLPSPPNNRQEVVVYQRRDLRSGTVTRIEAGYLGERLFYLNINNPAIPGYIRYQEGEYFHRNDFSGDQSDDRPGLDFDKANASAILSEFKKGLQGREVHHLRGGEIIEIQLYPFPEMPDKSYTYRIKKQGFRERVTNIFGRSDKKYERREVNLRDIFSGI